MSIARLCTHHSSCWTLFVLDIDDQYCDVAVSHEQQVWCIVPVTTLNVGCIKATYLSTSLQAPHQPIPHPRTSCPLGGFGGLSSASSALGGFGFSDGFSLGGSPHRLYLFPVSFSSKKSEWELVRNRTAETDRKDFGCATEESRVHMRATYHLSVEHLIL